MLSNTWDEMYADRFPLIFSPPKSSNTESSDLCLAEKHRSTSALCTFPKLHFWQASFQYLLLSHILLMNCVHTPATGNTLAQQICKFQTYQFFRVFGLECQLNLRGHPSFLPLADKKMNRRKQARLDFQTTSDFLSKWSARRHIEGEAELQIIRGKHHQTERNKVRTITN